jgi:hypothetical protein
MTTRWARRGGIWAGAFIVACLAIVVVAGIQARVSATPAEREMVRARCNGVAYLTSAKGEGAFTAGGYRRAIYICLPTRLTSPSAIIVTSGPERPVAVSIRSAWIPFSLVLILAAFILVQGTRYAFRKRAAP